MEPPSAYAEQRYKDGLECARRATSYDQQGHLSAALSFYSEAVEALNQACSLSPVFSPIQPRLVEYERRAEQIVQYLKSPKGAAPPRVSMHSQSGKNKKVLRQVEYLIEVAMRDDEKGDVKEAEKLYTCAVEVALQAQVKLTTDEDRQKVKLLVTNALARLEHLRSNPVEQPQPISDPGRSNMDNLIDQLDHLAPPSKLPIDQEGGKPVPKGTSKTLPRGPLTSFLDADSDLSTAPKFNAFSGRTSPNPGSSPRPPPGHHGTMGGRIQKGAKFTEKELKVLKATSVINGVTYLPWSDLDLVELKRVDPLSQDFEDPKGLIRLADKQKARLHGWMRPYDISENPKMAHLISSFTIKQTLIADCSFVSSLTVSADYERKFKTRLVTRLIHPQNRSGEPIINPTGKYYVSFNLNGCRRKVVIDDRLPVGHDGEMLCSYSSNRDEFWVSLIEKAYMKVMGGYDFPGSSSNIDLHALTGWIPERATLKKADDLLFKKMEVSLTKGNALITVATGVLSDTQADRAGLVPTHAYAVLSVVEYKGLKLLQLKNPWSHRRWKGNYSENDKTHWTPELRKALHFDQTQALQVDNGVFWIDWVSLCTFFDVAYLNWKPELFKHKSTIHDVWKPSAAEKDWYDISNNPQYCLRVNSSEPSATVWVLLSRHITAKNDFANNEKFITLNIAKSDGKRIFYPEKFLVMGIKINTPHYLAKLDHVPRGSSSYTIIVSQLESLSTIYYTLKVYSTCDFSLTPVPSPYEFNKQLKGEWFLGQKDPPKFRITTAAHSSHVLVKLRSPKELYGRLEMEVEKQGTDFQRVDTGPFRPGFSVLEAQGVPKGTFALYSVSYSGNQFPPKPVPFLVTVFCDNVFNFNIA